MNILIALKIASYADSLQMEIVGVVKKPGDGLTTSPFSFIKASLIYGLTMLPVTEDAVEGEIMSYPRKIRLTAARRQRKGLIHFYQPLRHYIAEY